MSGKRRVLVVEDDADTRERLSRAVAADPDLELCGQAGSCAEARLAFAAQQPQVVLIDLGLPDGHGAALIRELSGQDSSVLFMVITVFGDEAHVIEAIAAGASSYLLKDASAPQVARAIREMLAGGSPISPGVARYLLQRLQAPAAPKAQEPDPATRLSARESDVLNLVAKGYAYAEIGAALDISVNTVGSHVKQIYRKLAVRSRGEAVFEAIQRGLIGDLSGRP
ncbi:response regulator transcription factor [Solimonas sp. SE-A11]|uniref:response regulator n=1 Tax=Solimonas sp. SE-A11 TaxID=3054954 RepID=UPI00259CFCAA|nr:response regulator transcription factor [Solimonas sp. SE-A11]MDM4771572.1 response regulator transcription factor [Solimonas sp. SE-A11]